MQFHELVGLAGIDHLHVWTILLHQASEGECKLQGQLLLLCDSPHRTGILSAVAGIYYKCKLLVCSVSRHCKTTYRYQE